MGAASPRMNCCDVDDVVSKKLQVGQLADPELKKKEKKKQKKRETMKENFGEFTKWRALEMIRISNQPQITNYWDPGFLRLTR